MQLPVDIKAVFDEAMNIEEVSTTPLSVNIYMDESSPGDVQALIRQAFASSSAYVRVSTVYLPSFPAVASDAVDMAVIVAGRDEKIGIYIADIQASGIPVMVVSTTPELVYALARKSGHPLSVDEVVSLSLRRSSKKFLPENEKNSPTLTVLDDTCRATLKKHMGEWVIAHCKEKRLAFAMAFAFVRRTLSLEFVNATSLQNAGVGLLVILPGADLPVMTLNQAKMLLQIAAAYGQPMDTKRIKELAAVVGGAFLFRSLARQVVAFVPFLGWAIKASIGFTGTQAMGRAAIEYFEGGGSMSGLAEVVNKARLKAIEAARSDAGRKVIGSAKSFVSQRIKGERRI